MKLRFRQDGMQIVSCDPETRDWVVCGFSESHFGLDEDIAHGRMLATAPDLCRKAARYDDLIAAVRRLNEANTALLASEDAPAAAQEKAESDYEDALYDVLLFAEEDDHADAMERAGITCNELHTAKVTRSA